MADLTAALTKQFGVPVIDGVGAAVKMVEALVGLGLKTSKRGDLAFPLNKPFTGRLSDMAISPRQDR
jgi:allantoin racemase